MRRRGAPSTSASGLRYIEPELRQGRDEIALAERGELPELVTLGDIRGDLHCHTTLSDGKNSLEEMAEAAIDRGYSYLAVTDHSATHGFGNDVQPDALRRRIEEVGGAQRETLPKGFRLLSGSEVNILPDGDLDYDDDLLDELDWVVASVHTSFRMTRREHDRADRRRGLQPAGRLPRPPDRTADPAPRALRPGHGPRRSRRRPSTGR